jgi:DNA-binding LacI/PurR family transcriptional regulator
MKLEDVAKKAGVSKSTVSRVINNDPNVKAQTRSHVLAVIEANGYAPNPAARMLVTQRSQVIGAIVPNIPDFAFDDSFYFPTLMRGISDAVNKYDYGMLLWMGETDLDTDRFSHRVLKNRWMDGLIMISTEIRSQIVRDLLDLLTTFVMVERPDDDLLDRISYVSIDNFQAAVDAVTHLVGLGRRRIAMIYGKLNNIDAVQRVEGYRHALQAHGLPVDENLIVNGDYLRATAYEATVRLLRYQPDAIFVGNDQMAVGVLQALQAYGCHVPDDVAIIGFDDLPTATNTVPQLTTVRQPIRLKGLVAAEILINTLEGRIQHPKHVLLPTPLIIRETCGGQPNQEEIYSETFDISTLFDQ